MQEMQEMLPEDETELCFHHLPLEASLAHDHCEQPPRGSPCGPRDGQQFCGALVEFSPALELQELCFFLKSSLFVKSK